ncbi:Glyoxylate reductase [Durusdinium trenchii]|uniref:Glyoxylate reductase n=1 Tax=Durusdinium trenchii TaxID=1381693 RepID=A0ABP0N7J4_9DINO
MAAPLPRPAFEMPWEDHGDSSSVLFAPSGRSRRQLLMAGTPVLDRTPLVSVRLGGPADPRDDPRALPTDRGDMRPPNLPLEDDDRAEKWQGDPAGHMAEREPRLPLAGSTSVFSSTSIGSGWAMSPRFDSDVDDFWVKLPERPKSATASPRKPPGRPQRRRTSNGGQAGGALEGREKQAVPVKELVPPEVMKKVLDIARGGALVIEMLWSTSSYLPAHNNGQKYKQIAGELQELLEGRLSRGFPLPVLTLESPVKVKKAQGIYDRYSEWERDFNLVPSNGSYAYAVPSRVGAFEVHLVQGIWDPQRCTAALGPHQGPPVTGAWGVVCSACAQRWQGQKPPEVTTEEQKKEYEKQMKEQPRGAQKREDLTRISQKMPKLIQ